MPHLPTGGVFCFFETHMNNLRLSPLPLIWYNGEFREDGPEYAPGGQYVYEAMRATTSKLVFGRMHLERLSGGISHLGWEQIPAQFLIDRAFELIRLQDELTSMFVLRIMLWPGNARIDLAPIQAFIEPKDDPDDYAQPNLPLTMWKSSEYTLTRSDFFFKHGEARSWYRGALSLANSAGADEALFADTNGFLRETALRSIFRVHKGHLQAPPSGPVMLESVLRRVVLEELPETLQIGFVSLETEDVLLAGNVIRGIQPVQRIIGDEQLESWKAPAESAEWATKLGQVVAAAAHRRDLDRHAYPH
jgi:branched-subunit amino acid aminotransferase/4-amino-4-deoxychorismate lyase